MASLHGLNGSWKLQNERGREVKLKIGLVWAHVKITPTPKGAKMDLKDFVSEVLVQIIEGVGEANQTAMDKQLCNSSEAFKLGRSVGDKMNKPIRFDVAMTVRSEDQKGGKGKLQIAFLSAEGGADKSYVNEQISRVQFEIAIPFALSGKARPKA